MKLLSVPEISQFSCEGCIKFDNSMNCIADCKTGEIFKMEDNSCVYGEVPSTIKFDTDNTSTKGNK